jgi:hypothetical protein
MSRSERSRPAKWKGKSFVHVVEGFCTRADQKTLPFAGFAPINPEYRCGKRGSRDATF